MTAAISKALSSLTDVFGFLFNVVVVVIQSFIHSVSHSFIQSVIHSFIHSVSQYCCGLWLLFFPLLQSPPTTPFTAGTWPVPTLPP